MKFECADLEHAFASEDAQWLEAARAHAKSCSACRREIELDDALSAAARTLHREWDSPFLWSQTVAHMHAQGDDAFASRTMSRFRLGGAWQPVAAAAVLVLALGSATWLGWQRLGPGEAAPGADAAPDGLLSEDALAEIERSETQYVHAIDELTRIAGRKIEMPDSPLLESLRDRLIAIDAAIAEYRAEIDRNRFNAHLRRQLLWIYQEKRRTLERIEEYDPDAL